MAQEGAQRGRGRGASAGRGRGLSPQGARGRGGGYQGRGRDGSQGRGRSQGRANGGASWGQFGGRGGGRGGGRRIRGPLEGHKKVGKEGRASGGVATSEVNTSYRPLGSALTVEEIEADSLTQTANQNWSMQARNKAKPPPFKPDLVVSIYNNELHGSKPNPPKLKRIMMLEISQYLENYLIPNFGPGASLEHVMSMVVMLKEKFRENVPAWDGFASYPDVIPAFFQKLYSLRGERQLQMHERVSFLVFFIHAFQSLENEAVGLQVLRLVLLPMWHSLSPGRLQLERHLNDSINKRWKRLLKNNKEEEEKAKEAGIDFVPPGQRPEATFVASLVDEFVEMLETVVQEPTIMEEDGEEANGEAVGEADSEVAKQQLLYCERSVEFMVDLLSQAPTRRFTHAVLEDRAVLIKCRLSPLFSHQQQGRLFRQLVDLFQFYMAFPIDNFSSSQLSDNDVISSHYERIQQLQLLLFYKHNALKELALNNCGTVASRVVLAENLAELQEEELRKLVTRELRLLAEDDPWVKRREFLEEVLMAAFERKRSQTESINAMPLYPTEGILWDDNQVPSVHFTGESCLALPKLNLQFLTAHDYLLRNFNLFRLEATYEIREDIADVLGRVGASRDDDDNVIFRGWARMALPIDLFSIIEVRKPNVGENKPAGVEADVIINTAGCRGDVRSEWDDTKQHDVLFLLTIDPPEPTTLAALRAEAEATGTAVSPDKLYGLVTVRGCEVIEVKDEEGKLMNDFTGRVRREDWAPPLGFKRTLTVALDAAQYQLDMDHVQEIGDVYSSFNLLMRRKPKENNFKAVLESIRDLMNEATIIPEWLKDIFLGYGAPDGAQYTSIVKENPELFIQTVDFKDTFLDADHLRASFPDYQVEFQNNSGGPAPVRPFRVTFPPAPKKEKKGEKKRGKKRKTEDANGGAAEPMEGVDALSGPPKLVAESYVPPNPGPYPQDKPPENHVAFTPVQVEAIKAGVQHGLTMVVGPPGTGKTDTAVQIMHVLYHNCPAQRTLLITHSNQALNDLFEKLLQRDVPSRYLLRLGMGEAELATSQDFSRVGRVNTMLARRIELLAEVERMAKQFSVAEDMAYTCETAAHFWLMHVLARWEKFLAQVRQAKSAQSVQDFFPFKEYFSDAPGQLFSGKSYEEDLEAAWGCFRHLKTMFQELEECRAFELLKGQADRINYLMTKQAKIVAMTCTHAALKRREFLDLGFKYDNLLMEESAQILEIETFIPMLLQRQDDGVSRLKRVIMIGDHHQLPPVVKNMAFQKYSHLDQSLFTRFVRLGTPFVQLNAQGRARPSLAQLYSWRYTELGDLPNVRTAPEYLRANPGFAYDYQFIDVADFQGAGENTPMPHFYQNLGEAEYVVSLFQYMRLRGYPADKISILTTYNGQKALLRDVVERRCASHPAFGRPRTVQTVDKYQGQQNDYILLSLVRTRAAGHLRDVRRLVVAMSRARLGLYVFGRQALFANCYELQPTFQQLLARPTQLALHPREYFQSCERPVGEVGEPHIVPSLQAMAQLLGAMTAEWEIATHNATMVQLAAQQAAQQPVKETTTADMTSSKGTEAPAAAAAEEAVPDGLHIVEDLVDNVPAPQP